MLASPGRTVQSVAQASFDAWVKYYRSDENSPNATISYYTKGALVALALDLTLRADGGSLDAVMRGLWQRSAGGPIAEDDIAAVLAEVGGRSYAKEIAAWAHGTADLPLQRQPQAATLAQRLAVRASESALTGIKLTHVLRGGAGEQAGLAPGDELIAVNDWRVRRLDDALRVLKPGEPGTLLVVREQRVLRLTLALPKDVPGAGGVNLVPEDKPAKAALALRGAWLDG